MNFIINNWYYILFCMLMVIVSIYGCTTGKALEWLKYAVAKAEQDLGSGTGQLKLRKVYDMFIDKFPAFSTVLPFTIFSKLVDVALEWLDDQLNKNVNISTLVKGE